MEFWEFVAAATGGCLSMFGKTWRKVTKGSMVIAKGDRIGTLYLCPHNTDYYISVASIEIHVALWHHRLGHMSEKGMQISTQGNCF